MRRPLVLTSIDEALLSAINFGAAAVLIRAASKTEFGVFTLVNGIILLLRGVQSSVIVTPLTTHGSQLAGTDRERFVAAVARFQRVLAVASAVLLGAALLVRGGPDAFALAGAAALSTIGSWSREFQRSVWLLDDRNGIALAGDVVYAVLAAGGVAIDWYVCGTVTTAALLAILGVAAFVPGMIGLARHHRLHADDPRATARLLYDQGRWTLPGMAVMWGQTTGYSYLVSMLVDTSAVAMLATARLFIMPVMLLVTAWGRIFLPRAGAQLGRGETSGPRQLAVRGAIQLVLIAVGYIAAVAIVLASGILHALSAKYEGIAMYVAMWCGFAVISVIRSTASNALLAHKAFKELFVYSTCAALVSLGSVLVLVVTVGLGGAIVGMVFGELLLLILSWRRLLRTCRA